MAQKKEKDITINQLARMVQKGFDGVDEKHEKFREEVNNRFNEMERRFDRIEGIIIEGHRQRIDQLEDRVKLLEADFRSLVSKR